MTWRFQPTDIYCAQRASLFKVLDAPAPPTSVEAYSCTGDTPTLFAARREARKNFENNRNLPAGTEELSKQITHAEEVAKFLRENVVQGQAADNAGNYSTSERSCSFNSTFR